MDETKDEAIINADSDLTKADIVVQDAEIKGQKLSGYEELTFWQTVKHFKMATLYCVIPSIAAAADGYQAGINGSIIAQKGFIHQFGTKFNAKGVKILDPKVVVAISVIQAVGSMCGLLSLPFFSARFGRQKAFYLIWVLLALSVMFESIARRWEVWFVAKLLSGLGIGSIQFNTPTYIAECSPVKIRGVLLFTYDIWFSVGGLIATVALDVMNEHRPTDWQIPVYTQWALIGTMAIIYLCIPESPFWCANGGREEQGRAALRRFHRDVEDFDEDRQWEVMVLTVNHERQVAEINGGGKWVDIFKGVDGFRTLACAWTIVAAQLLGLPLINTYAAYFFSQLNLTNPFLLTAITKAPQIGVGIICAFLVDSVGRRNLCCGFLTLMWFCCLGMAVTGCVPVTHSMTIALVFLASLFMCAVTAATSIGYGLMGELPAQRHRAHTAGFSAGSAGIFNITNIAIAPYMLSTSAWNWGGKSFFLYTGLGFVAAFGSWFIIPEPAGRTQAELDEMFEAKVRPWRFRGYKTATQMAIEAQQRAQR